MTVSHVNPVSEQLKLSIAIELLSTRIDTMQVHFDQDPEQYSPEDWEDYIKCAAFLNEHGRRNYSVTKVKEYLDSL